MKSALGQSRALWNRNGLDLHSDEILAQVLDRGEPSAWRELYALAKTDQRLRQRIIEIVRTTPLPLPHFWMALLASLGEPVEFDASLPSYGEWGP